MGAKSTIDLTRSEAISFILENVHNVDDSTLEILVDDLNDRLRENGEDNLGLHNFSIVCGKRDRDLSFDES